jgi:rhodanese-related sulfurtransferase
MQPSQPSPAELQDMSQKALQVVRLLEEFKRVHIPDSERTKLGDPMYEASEDHRAPKRPWEDMAQGGNNADVPEDVSCLLVCRVTIRLTILAI